MNVQPGFLDHPKTLRLCRLLQDERAPLYVLRLWEFSQMRRTPTHERMDADTLAAVCRYAGEPKKLFVAMKEARFIDVRGKTVTAHGWIEANSKLIASWENGRKNEGKRESALEPTGYPRDTQDALGIPKQNRTEPDEGKKTEPDEQNQTGPGEPAEGSEAPELPAVSDSDLSRSSALLSGLTAAECVRFVSTGDKRKRASSRTLEELANNLPEQVVRDACAKVYAARLQGRARNPAGMLTAILRNDGNGQDVRNLAAGLLKRSTP